MDLITRSRQQINTMLLYLFVGVINTSITSFIMFFLASLEVSFVIYTAIGYVCGMICSFLLNLKITFQVDGQVKKRLANFFLINLINLFIVELLEIYLIVYKHTPHLTAVIIAMSWYVCFGFVMNQWIVFRQNYYKKTYYA